MANREAKTTAEKLGALASLVDSLRPDSDERLIVYFWKQGNDILLTVFVPVDTVTPIS